MIRQKYILLLTDGGMGDLICYLVAVDYLIKTFTHMEFLVYVPDYLHKFACHVLPPRANIISYSKGHKDFPQGHPGLSTAWNAIHTPMRTHPVDYAFHVLADRHEYRLENKNYLQIRPEEINIKRFKLPDKYVTIVATAAEPCKTMPTDIATQIIDCVVEKGYTPVFIGRQEANTGFQNFKVKGTILDLDYSKGINLIDKTSLLETAAVITGAKCFVGMDGGPTHLAGCTQTPIIAGYTIVDPIHIAPIRKGSQRQVFFPIEPDIVINDRYYQTTHNFLKKDYRDFDYEPVLANLTFDKWQKALDNIFKEDL